jgi:hypothetical protein
MLYVLYSLSFCKRCEIVLRLIFYSLHLQTVTGDRQNKQCTGALDEMLSGKGVSPKKVVLVVDRIDVLGKHADGRKVTKMALPPLCIQFESILATVMCQDYGCKSVVDYPVCCFGYTQNAKPLMFCFPLPPLS